MKERRKLKASKTHGESDGAAPDLTRDGCVNILGPFISLREVRSVLLISSKLRDVNLAEEIKLWSFCVKTGGEMIIVDYQCVKIKFSRSQSRNPHSTH